MCKATCDPAWIWRGATTTHEVHLPDQRCPSAPCKVGQASEEWLATWQCWRPSSRARDSCRGQPSRTLPSHLPREWPNLCERQPRRTECAARCAIPSEHHVGGILPNWIGPDIQEPPISSSPSLEEDGFQSSQAIMFVCQDKPWLHHPIKFIASGEVTVDLG